MTDINAFKTISSNIMNEMIEQSANSESSLYSINRKSYEVIGFRPWNGITSDSSTFAFTIVKDSFTPGWSLWLLVLPRGFEHVKVQMAF